MRDMIVSILNIFLYSISHIIEFFFKLFNKNLWIDICRYNPQTEKFFSCQKNDQSSIVTIGRLCIYIDHN